MFHFGEFGADHTLVRKARRPAFDTFGDHAVELTHPAQTTCRHIRLFACFSGRDIERETLMQPVIYVLRQCNGGHFDISGGKFAFGFAFAIVIEHLIDEQTCRNLS